MAPPPTLAFRCLRVADLLRRAGSGVLDLAAAWWPGARCGRGWFRFLGVAISASEVALQVEHRSETAMELSRRGGATVLPQIGIHGTT